MAQSLNDLYARVGQIEGELKAHGAWVKLVVPLLVSAIGAGVWFGLGVSGQLRDQDESGTLLRCLSPELTDVERAASCASAAGQGSAVASRVLGTLHLNGQGVAQNSDRAVELFREAAAKADPAAQLILGNLSASGAFVAQNWSEAAKWYKLAAERGQREAAYKLGELYLSGQGVERNPTEAAKWIELAAERGLFEAQIKVSQMYRTGTGLAVDPEAAESWAARARATPTLDGASIGVGTGSLSLQHALASVALRQQGGSN